MQSPVPNLVTMTLPPGATKVQARLVFDGVRGAIFEYTNGGPVGALVSSWARSAGTDPYGNAYAAGLTISVGSIIGTDFIVENANGGVFVYSGTPALGNPPVAWMANTTTDPYGNSLPSTTGVAGTGTFQAGDTLITASGVYTYSGTPALGLLIASLSPTAGTDPYGDTTLAGITAYPKGSGETFAVSLSQLSGLVPGLSIQNLTLPAHTPAGLFANISNVAAAVSVNSGQVTASDVQAELGLLSQTDSLITNGQILLTAGETEIGVNNTVIVNDNTGAVNVGRSGTGTITIAGSSAVINPALTVNSKETITAGGLAVTGGTTTDTLDATSTATISGALTATGGTPSSPTSITTDTVHAMSLLNSWANAASPNQPASYYLEPISGEVHICGAISGAAATSATIATLPSGYYNTTHQQAIACGATAGVAAGESPYIQVDTSGNVTVHAVTVPTAGMTIVFNGSYSLNT
jgi:hypothetical protein